MNTRTYLMNVLSKSNKIYFLRSGKNRYYVLTIGEHGLYNITHSVALFLTMRQDKENALINPEAAGVPGIVGLLRSRLGIHLDYEVL